MKRNFVRTLLIIIAVCFVLTASQPYALADSYRYQGNVEFYFSNDGGARYGREGRIFYSDETILMQVRFSVTIVNRRLFTSATSQVSAVLTIPNIDAVDVIYMEGQIVDPVIDHVNNVMKYEYTMTAESNPAEQRIVFQLKPNDIASLRMTFEFDEDLDINPTSNSQHTVEFIEREIIIDESDPEDGEEISDGEEIIDDTDEEPPEIIDSNDDLDNDLPMQSQKSDNNILVIVLIGVGVAIVISITTLIIVLIKLLPRKK
jgi:hypothetical protein